MHLIKKQNHLYDVMWKISISQSLWYWWAPWESN